MAAMVQSWEDGFAMDVEDSRAKIGIFMSQRDRRLMEDSVTVIPDFDGGKSTLIGVYDGHGGRGAARFCTKYLHRYLLRNANFAAGKYEEAFREVFLQMDRLMRSKGGLAELRSLDGGYNQVDREPELVEMEMEEVHGSGGGIEAGETTLSPLIGMGTTALVVLVTGDQLIVANAGDSHCTLFLDFEKRGLRGLSMSLDHNLDHPGEASRVCNAGGYLDRGYRKMYAMVTPPEGRPLGLLCTRTLGDIGFKMNPALEQEQQAIIAVPDVKSVSLAESDIAAKVAKYVVIASDGLEKSRLELHADDFKQGPLSTIAERIAARCAGSDGDNATIVLVELKKDDNSVVTEADIVAAADLDPGFWYTYMRNV